MKYKKREFHGMTGTLMYARWANMIARCTDPNHAKYEYYGGRGITVCERWKNFTAFRDDMGELPFKGATLERNDNDKGYSPDNCRWASRAEQNGNRRNCKGFVLNGEKINLKDVCKERGVPYSTVQKRIARGVSVELALNIPIHKKRQETV